MQSEIEDGFGFSIEIKSGRSFVILISPVIWFSYYFFERSEPGLLKFATYTICYARIEKGVFEHTFSM